MDSDFSHELECPHCGATFNYELTHCPNCGINIYFPEDEEDGGFSESFASFIDSFRFPLGILAGWIAAIVLSLSLYLPIRFTFTAPQSQVVIYSLVTACISVGAFGGGFLAIRIAKGKVIVGAALVGLVSIGIAVAILLREWATVIPFPGVILGWFIILLATFAGAKIAENMLRKATFESLFVVPLTEENLYQDLFIKTGYDHEVTKRLIEYERQRAPQATRLELIRSAIQHWERDNRAG
jgi:hypothetical protein